MTRSVLKVLAGGGPAAAGEKSTRNHQYPRLTVARLPSQDAPAHNALLELVDLMAARDAARTAAAQKDRADEANGDICQVLIRAPE